MYEILPFTFTCSIILYDVAYKKKGIKTVILCASNINTWISNAACTTLNLKSSINCVSFYLSVIKRTNILADNSCYISYLSFTVDTWFWWKRWWNHNIIFSINEEPYVLNNFFYKETHFILPLLILYISTEKLLSGCLSLCPMRSEHSVSLYVIPIHSVFWRQTRAHSNIFLTSCCSSIVPNISIVFDVVLWKSSPVHSKTYVEIFIVFYIFTMYIKMVGICFIIHTRLRLYYSAIWHIFIMRTYTRVLFCKPNQCKNTKSVVRPIHLFFTIKKPIYLWLLIQKQYYAIPTRKYGIALYFITYLILFYKQLGRECLKNQAGGT